jgi:hypothetical protein
MPTTYARQRIPSSERPSARAAHPSLASSAILTGLKQRLDRRPGADELKRPVTLSILLMRALGLFWAVSHHLGSE